MLLNMVYLHHKGTVITDLRPHSLTFQFHQPKTNEASSIKDLQKYLSGTFAVSGCIQWSTPSHKPEEDSTKYVRGWHNYQQYWLYQVISVGRAHRRNKGRRILHYNQLQTSILLREMPFHIPGNNCH